MTAAPILPITRERVVSRRDASLSTAWVHRDQPSPPTLRGTLLGTGAPASLQLGDTPALVLLGRGPEALTDLLAQLDDHTGRTYVLVDGTSSRTTRFKRLAKLPRVLVRRVPEVPVSGVWAGRAAFIGLSRGSHLRLDQAGAAGLRHLFLRLFWHEATKEGWTEGGKLAWRDPLDRPFDVPDLPAEGPLRLLPAGAQLPESGTADLVYLRGSALPSQAPRRLWVAAGPRRHEALGRLVAQGTDVVWDELSLPELRLDTDHSGVLLFGGKQARLQVTLAPEQGLQLRAALDRPTAWRFETDVCIGSDSVHDAELWLAGEARARPLITDQACPLGDVRSPELRSMPSVEPSVWTEPDPLALAVQYVWSVLPPRVPHGASVAPLVTAWRAVDADWDARVQAVEAKLAAAKAHRGRVRSALAHLKSAMLGLGRKEAALGKQATALARQVPSQGGPRTAEALRRDLEALEEATEKLAGEITAAEVKGREEEARNAQKAAWEADVSAARRELPEARSRLAETEAEEVRLKDELAALAAELELLPRAERADPRARQKSRRDALKHTTTTAKRLRQRCAALAATVAAPFEFKRPPTPPTPRSRSRSRFVPEAPAGPRGPELPGEALPEVGDLRVSGGARFLVLDDLDDLDAAEASATRLGAQLVAPEQP